MKLVHDSNSPEAVAARHAAHMKALFGRMLQVAASGGGMKDIGELLDRAHESFMEIAEHDETFRANRHAWQEVETALRPAIKDERDVPHDSFAANKSEIVRMSLRVAAHTLLENHAPLASAQSKLRNAVFRVNTPSRRPRKRTTGDDDFEL